MEDLLRRPAIENLSPAIEHSSVDDEVGPTSPPVHAKDGPGTPRANSPVFSAPITSELKTGPTVKVARVPARANHRRAWMIVVSVVLCALAGTALFAVFISRRQQRADAGRAPVVSDSEQKSLIETEMSEAGAMLAAGNVDGAISRLREAVRRDPSNARAHRLLGEALLRSGARREAIDEYIASTRNDPKDAATWHALASAQFAEELYADAVESYRRLIALSGEEALDDTARLEYADALRLAGDTEDARRVYQKVAASAPEDLAHAAEKHLSELSPPRQATSTNVNANINVRTEPSPEPLHDARVEPTTNRAGGAIAAQPVASPSPVPSPVTQSSPPPAPVKHDVAQTDPDTYYSQALNIVKGRDLKTLPRAELLHALELFQRANSGSAHRDQAGKYIERLGKEYDRRRNQH